MPKASESQKETVDRVMHEFKHGELERGPGGAGGKVRSRKQAIAIALDEAGETNRKSPAENRKTLRRTKAKEARGDTAMQEKEGRGAETRTELYEEARRRGVRGRSKMTRAQLQRALH
jgi:hypothetical protein